MSSQPFISVIVPVYNGAEHIERCLEALLSSSYRHFEIIVVDDCSTDESVKIAQEKGVNVIRLRKQSGPAVARNIGAKRARGEIVLFIDSDVIVRRETISQVADNFQSHPDVTAVFGSYDDEPGDGSFFSQYRNMFHHYHHQHSETEAFSFWAGCGAIRKRVFEEAGGFDYKKYLKPSIEDIELGYRLRRKGHRILLDKDLQVKHLKNWKFAGMLRTDIFQRAIPWSRLIMETKFMPRGLNLKLSHKVSSLSVALIILTSPFLALVDTKLYDIAVAPAAALFISALLVALFFLNRSLYGFYARKRGLWFMVRVFPLHLLYYLYSGVSFLFCWITYKISLFEPIYRLVAEQNARVQRKT